MRMHSLSLLILCSFHFASSHKQSVTIKGVTICNKKRMANVEIELWEADVNAIGVVDPHDKLSSIHTNKDGEFELFGEEDEIGQINPYLLVHHTCNVEPGCKRVSEYLIPEKYIGSTYEMTYVTLDIATHNERTDC